MSRFLDFFENVDAATDSPPGGAQSVQDPTLAQKSDDAQVHKTNGVGTDSDAICCPKCGSQVGRELLFCSECQSFLGQTCANQTTDANESARGRKHREGYKVVEAVRRWLRLA